ncbi:hypothetical protein ElyMa_004030700 [Elysia marginata]|uniref:Mutator-like transposase domain-containing protein n=1 Tax=Elysia marginata TaxID=1093978 RepID=A0AAV4G3I7_9GAST|nr:hypothetical protein ElyMa_004030700 [Elysia marginata]
MANLRLDLTTIQDLAAFSPSNDSTNVPGPSNDSSEAGPEGIFGYESESDTICNEPGPNGDFAHDQPGPSADSSDDSDMSLHLHFSGDEDDEPVQESAAWRKLNILSNDVGGDPQDTGYLLVHFSFLDKLVAALCCPFCSDQSLSLEKTYKGGLSSMMKVWCRTCDDYIFSEYSSPGAKRKDITKRLVLAAKESGLGYKGVCNFFSILNMHKPLHKTFQEISATVHTAAIAEAEKCMQKTAEHISNTTVIENPGQLAAPAAAISYDGTWHKHGHSSHFGVGVAIDCKSGFVLDTQVLSNYRAANPYVFPYFRTLFHPKYAGTIFLR